MLKEGDNHERCKQINRIGGLNKRTICTLLSLTISCFLSIEKYYQRWRQHRAISCSAYTVDTVDNVDMVDTANMVYNEILFTLLKH